MSEIETPAVAIRSATWAGHPLDDDRVELLIRLVEWLTKEAIPAGGLGPREGARLWSRHIADSLSFAVGWPGESPGEILDVGSGVGLPGIPLAVLWPDTTVTLLDRAGRRIRLLRRVVRILGLQNVVVAQGDVFSVGDQWQGIVYRGAVRAPEAVGLSARLLEPSGVAVLGLSRRNQPPDRTADLTTMGGALGLRTEITRVPSEVLDAIAWLLIMRQGE